MTGHVPTSWAGTLASCLAHRERMFWQPIWKCWVHSSGCVPCESMAGEPDPEELHCRYCNARVKPDGAGRLLEYTGAEGHWRAEPCVLHGEACASPPLVWHRDPYSEKCPVSPTFRHEVSALHARGRSLA